jgi:integrase/recombinase XerD
MDETNQKLNNVTQATVFSMDELTSRYFVYAEVEMGYRPETLTKYKDSLLWVFRLLPHIKHPSEITYEDVLLLKKRSKDSGKGESRINSIVNALKSFLRYCSVVGIKVIDQSEIKQMKLPKREVVYLTKEEVSQLRSVLKKRDVRTLRMLALVDLLLTSGGRISEILNLNKDGIDWENKEARVIGKGNKDRVVYFTEEALGSLRHYLLKRTDNELALFVTIGKPKKLTRRDLSKVFGALAVKAGIKKRLTPHILRHTMATTLLNNGCDIRHIQQMLGHTDIKTTAKYYLGTDRSAIKNAHSKYLNFS